MRITAFIALVVLLTACNNNPKLPVYGSKTAFTKTVDGKTQTDSIDYTIPPFALVDQDSTTVNNATTRGKIYIADFFFTSCPSICPKMKKEMLRVYEKYKDNNEVIILSFSIDPKRDTVARLKAYAGKLGIEDNSKWHFLTGDKDSIYAIADNFLVSAAEDPDAPGGHIHSGNFILVDKQNRIRGYYDGTSEESTTKLLQETDLLLNEK